VSIVYLWRGTFTNVEVNALHAEAFRAPTDDVSERNWSALVERQSLGWVLARDDGRLVGFVNVTWDGLLHAWILDTMVASGARRRGVGKNLVATARAEATHAGCEWLHVDFTDDLRPFYVDACGFTPTSAGLMALREAGHSS